MSLSRRLIVGMLILVGVGLVITDVATYSYLRSFLSGRINDELSAGLSGSYRIIVNELEDNTFGTPAITQQVQGVLPENTCMVYVSASGRALETQTCSPSPTLPPNMPFNALGALGLVNADPNFPPQPANVQLGAQGRSGILYRAQMVPLPNGDVLIVGVSLESMNLTLSHLVAIEAIVTGVVIALLVLLVFVVVKGALRPLESMAQTAGEIAKGDLSKRVTPATSETEVGRLGEALNAMLGQIEQAFDERTASEHRLRRFVADASHELRTPLTSIRGYAELFRRGAARDAEGLERAMGRIESEASRMSTLVDDLLLLARLDQGRPLASEPLDLQFLVEEGVSDARVVDPDRPIDFESDGGPIMVEGDEDRLRQVVANLLSNALTHTPAGTPVHVGVSAEGDEGVIEVRDEGPGLGVGQIDKVFERFFRTDASRSRGGAGLGLSIVSAIARAHGGSASVSSVAGDGAAFKVTLPLLAAHHSLAVEETGDVSPAKGTAGTPAGPSRHGAREKVGREAAASDGARVDERAPGGAPRNGQGRLPESSPAEETRRY